VLRREQAEWAEIGHTDMQLMEKTQIEISSSRRGISAGFLTPRRAFSPLNYMLGIAQAVQKGGGKIYDETPAVEIISSPSPSLTPKDASAPNTLFLRALWASRAQRRSSAARPRNRAYDRNRTPAAAAGT